MGKTKNFASVIERYCSTRDGRRAMAVEQAVSELECVMYNAAKHLTQAELSKTTGCGMRMAKRILDGCDEIPLRKAASILAMLDKQLTVSVGPITLGQPKNRKKKP